MKTITCDLCHTEAEPLLQLTTKQELTSANPKRIYNTYEVWCMCSKCHTLVHTVPPDDEIRLIINTTPILPGMSITRGTL